ncbi:MAG: hypothetical protein D6767_08045, partial [Candidatus Hydrogenedentota bacterium]
INFLQTAERTFQETRKELQQAKTKEQYEQALGHLATKLFLLKNKKQQILKEYPEIISTKNELYYKFYPNSEKTKKALFQLIEELKKVPRSLKGSPVLKQLEKAFANF